MVQHKTQQFARFFIKGPKTKDPRFDNEKSDFEKLIFSTSVN